MKCSFCDRQFNPQAARRACRSCALFGGCQKIKCPYCGYETPAEPRLITWLKKGSAKLDMKDK